MKRVVLLGAPGAGKDTLADQLQKHFSCTTITPGSILRREANLGTPLGLKAKNEYWGKGNLCPDDIINSLIGNTLDRLKNKQSEYLVFNGYPRSLGQAKYLDDVHPVDIVIDLDVSKDIAVKRLLARRREDDTQDVIETRFEDYLSNNIQVVEFYKNSGVYTKINANQMIPRVWKDVLDLLNK